jgi:hypothetical protein
MRHHEGVPVGVLDAELSPRSVEGILDGANGNTGALDCGPRERRRESIARVSSRDLSRLGRVAVGSPGPRRLRDHLLDVSGAGFAHSSPALDRKHVYRLLRVVTDETEGAPGLRGVPRGSTPLPR